ncbi:MAG: hypothetical protein Q4E76_06185 [Tissierellia bacterium]|nr:hypothetical protein [Tissierellia bacterium]
MLQSSVLVRIFLGLLSALEQVYLHSRLHQFLAALGRFLRRLFQGSLLGSFLYSLDGLLYTSVTAKIWVYLYRFINTVIAWIQLRLEGAFEDSYLYRFLHGFKTLPGGLYRGGMMSVGFGMGLLVLYVLTHRVMGLLGAVFLLGGAISLFFCRDIEGRSQSSLLMRMLLWLVTFFLTDEEAEQWQQEK